jgi:3-oxoacyl-[acyl-carrier protein] reductase
MNMNRRILITGASEGLGLAMAEYYLERGDSVIGCSRSDASIEHPHYSHFSLDVSDDEAVQMMFDALRRLDGHLDALINNAGVAGMNPVALMPPAVARRILETNVLGTFHFIRHAIRLLRRSNSGRIINMTTVAVPLNLEGEAVYAASKAAIESLTKIVAREMGAFGITCNAVGPGPAHTRLTQNVPARKMEALLSRQAIPRWTEPADVINVVDFFLQPESSLVTGQVIYLGGVCT